jgi:hypothetical protein
MYEELKQAFRRALKVTLTEWVDKAADVLILSIEFNGRTLWKRRYSRIAIEDAITVKYIYNEQRIVGEKVIDQILEGVDWDNYCTGGK